jgi:hypothetical protein
LRLQYIDVILCSFTWYGKTNFCWYIIWFGGYK